MRRLELGFEAVLGPARELLVDPESVPDAGLEGEDDDGDGEEPEPEVDPDTAAKCRVKMSWTSCLKLSISIVRAAVELSTVEVAKTGPIPYSCADGRELDTGTPEAFVFCEVVRVSNGFG